MNAYNSTKATQKCFQYIVYGKSKTECSHIGPIIVECTHFELHFLGNADFFNVQVTHALIGFQLEACLLMDYFCLKSRRRECGCVVDLN